MGNLSVRECVTKVYQAARDGSSDLEKILKRLKTTEQRKTALWKQKLKMAAILSLLLSSLLTMDT